MSTDRHFTDPDGERARLYRAALLRASGRVPDDQIDWDAFHTRLAARAELSLARLRHPHVAPHALPAQRTATLREHPSTVQWWEPAARWSRLVVAASVAAGIALIMVVRMSPKDVSDTVVATTAANSAETEGRRAAFESAAIGRGSKWTIDSALLPSATVLLVPLGKGAPSQ